jgi:glutaredoxin 3
MAKVTIYTRGFCPYCSRAVALLKSKGADFTEIDAGASAALKEEMVTRAGGRKTFPQIFVGDRHIGGCDDMVALDQDGGLDPLLAG